MDCFTFSQAGFAKQLLFFGGLLDLPPKNRDADTLVPLRYERGEVIGRFEDKCNLGNLAKEDAKIRWREFSDETRESTRRWARAVGLDKAVGLELSYTSNLEYGDLRRVQVVVKAQRACRLMVPALSDTWWDASKKKMRRENE